MPVTPYLFLDGRAEEAIEFYKKNLGAKVEMMMRFKDAPPNAGGPAPDPKTLDKVMHACITINGTQVFVSDGDCTGKGKFEGFSLALDAKEAAEGERMFNSLSQGGQVRMPMMETFFAQRFGMLADKFGVGWMIMAGSKNP
jgi:PhnB protein